MSFKAIAKQFAGFLAFVALLGTSAYVEAQVPPPVPPSVSVSFSPSSISQGSTSYLIISIYNADSVNTLNGGTISSYAYPSIVNTATAPTNYCAGSILTVTPGLSDMSLASVSLPPFNNCFIYIEVTTAGAGTFTTTFPAGGFTGFYASGTGTNAASASATLTVVAPIVVTNTLDIGPGSLRDAISALNSSCTPNISMIRFNITGPGGPPYTIVPATELPAITCAGSTVDGYMQPGSLQNTNTLGGNDAIIQVGLQGTPACVNCNGLTISADGVTVKGLAIYSFGGSGVLINAPVNVNLFGNYIGTDPGGMNAYGNTVAGVRITTGYLTLGSGSSGDRNLVSANGIGVWVAGGAANISNNQIGGKRDGSAGNGNTGRGIFLNGANYNYYNYINDNFVRYNGAAGIAVDSATTGYKAISANASYANGGIGIDFNDDGPTLNDEAAPPYDTDGVPNYPRITSVTHVGSDTVVIGYLKSAANSSVRIELYHNSVLRSQTEGEKLIDAFTTSLDITGDGTFSRTIAGFLADNVSAATASICGDGCYSRSSEYSPSKAFTPPPPTVPGAPTIGTATAGNAQATVTFSPPASDGGSAITSYTVTSSPGGITASGSGSPITVTGLTNGTTYTFTVTATNAVGVGPASAASNAVTPAAPAPSLALTPPSLTFAARMTTTTSPAQTVTLTNSGLGTLSIVSITVNGDFAFTTNCPASVVSGATCTIDVTFTPLTTGTRTGTLTVASTASGSPHAVSLSGTGQAAAGAVVDLSPATLEFAPQEVGSDSAPGLVRVVNGGNAMLNFRTIAASGDFVALTGAEGQAATQNQLCGAALAPGAVCELAIRFHPTTTGILEGTLQVTSDASNSPASVRLLGTGVVTVPLRTLGVSERLAFDPQPVGTRSPGRALAITNNSASTASITDLAASGPDFSVSDTCATIAPHATCSPLVFFQPTALGERSGTLTIRTLSEVEPYVVSLAGTGVINTVPTLSVSVTRLGYGNVLLGSATSRTIVLTNIGMVPVSLGAINASGDFLVTSGCGSAIAVGASCSLEVVFFPRMTGGQVGSVEIVSNAAEAPHHVQLSGVGCAIPSIARARLGQLLCGS